MDEAEAEVDLEDRAVQHTETLKLLPVLYFNIIKSPTPTQLLPSALERIARYAHLTHMVFFLRPVGRVEEAVRSSRVDPFIRCE